MGAVGGEDPDHTPRQRYAVATDLLESTLKARLGSAGIHFFDGEAQLVVNVGDPTRRNTRRVRRRFKQRGEMTGEPLLDALADRVIRQNLSRRKDAFVAHGIGPRAQRYTIRR